MIAYFNCSSGISGDMILGALVDAGVSREKLEKELSRLPVRGYKLNIRKVKRSGFRATKVDVILQGKGTRGKGSGGRTWKDIKEIAEKSTLSEKIKKQGLSIFRRLFEAEAKVHGRRYDKVHLHELGAVDCMVDIFGALIGFDILGIKEVYASSINLGSGTIKTEHGMLSVPAPATALLLKKVPVYSSGVSFELTTPTGAVIITSLVRKFGPMSEMYIQTTAIGAGGKDFKEQPNILTMYLGEAAGGVTRAENEIVVIETNIDDMNPQVYEYAMDRLFRAGALDVFLTGIIMKKRRPGTKLSVLCGAEKKDTLIEIILKETTSIGLRFYRADRRVLQRQQKSIKTKFGPVKVKEAVLGSGKVKRTAEYDDAKKIAKKFNIPLIDVLKCIS